MSGKDDPMENTVGDKQPMIEEQDDAAVTTSKRKFPLRETTIGPLKFNWLVSVIGIGVLWGIAIFCMSSENAGAELRRWYDTTILYFSWFYIVGNPIMTFFIFWVAYRYGNLKLGPKDAEPEFSNVAYFAMLFSAGVGVGLFFFGVSEPLFHQSGNYFTERGYHSQNEIDQWALVITMYHWGFAAWSPYLMVAISGGLGAYCFGLPLTVRSTFFPILGKYTWGWIGDLIDGWSIVMTVAGVCTSLGLGVIQMNTGIRSLGWVSESANDTTVNTAIIWVITAFATLSVVSGLEKGIKILSITGFSLGCLILFLCFVMEKSYYQLNLLVQSTGYYLQWGIFQLPFFTDAFGSLKEGEGRAVDGKTAPAQWMGWWTVFYMAWWVAWSCFVGLFIARISKNRTLRSVIVGVFIGPTIYSIIWFSFIGGIGLRQERQARELEVIGDVHFDDPSYFASSENPFCYDVPQEDVYNQTGGLLFTNTLPGITPVCQFDSSQSTMAWFNVMNSFSYPGTGASFGPFLSGLSLFTLAIYFITSSDSGSLVVDILSTNGAEDHHWLQRVFWAVTEGAVATSILVAGGSDALGALQAASIVFGLPFNFFIVCMCYSVYLMCDTLEKHESGKDVDPNLLLPKKTWGFPIFGGIFNIFEYIFSFGMVHKDLEMSFPTKEQTIGFAKNLLLPFLSIHSIYSAIDLKGLHKLSNVLATITYALSHCAWIALFICGTVNYGFVAFGWAAFFLNACILTSLRMDFRTKHGIVGNIFGDFIASSFLYPQALLQMELHLAEGAATDTHEISMHADGERVTHADGESKALKHCHQA